MGAFNNAMQFLLTAMDGMRNRPTQNVVPGQEGTGPAKTKRGATHVVNPPAKSVQISDVTPAQWRREHRGRHGKKP